jgi:hypothetical protein
MMRSHESANADGADAGSFAGNEKKKEVKIEEHAIVVGWYNDVTIVSGGTDEMIYFWEIGLLYISILYSYLYRKS